MKKLSGILLVMIIALACSSGIAKPETDLAGANLKGKVSRIQKTIHNANSKLCCPASEKNDCKQSIYVYNEKGFITESSNLDIDGDIQETSKYIYDRNDLCTEIDKYSGDQLTGRELNTYDGVNLVETRVFDKNGEISNINKYEYTNYGLSKGTVYSKTGVLLSSFENGYLNGQLDSQTEKDDKGEIVAVTKYKRNTNNDVIETVYTNNKINSVSVLTFDYEYDNEGNWIKKTQVYEGEIMGIILRNIDYFNV
jgi:hypothetical protein